MVSTLVDSVSDADSHSQWGEIGEPIEGSIYLRDYCLVCGQPIRVEPEMIGKPNSCQECDHRYRGRPGVSTYETYKEHRNIFEQILDGEETDGQTE